MAEQLYMFPGTEPGAAVVKTYTIDTPASETLKLIQNTTAGTSAAVGAITEGAAADADTLAEVTANTTAAIAAAIAPLAVAADVTTEIGAAIAPLETAMTYRAVSTNDTAAIGEYLLVDAGAALSIAIPAGTTVGQTIKISDVGTVGFATNNVTLTGGSTDVLNVSAKEYTLVYTGAAWKVLQ